MFLNGTKFNGSQKLYATSSFLFAGKMYDKFSEFDYTVAQYGKRVSDYKIQQLFKANKLTFTVPAQTVQAASVEANTDIPKEDIVLEKVVEQEDAPKKKTRKIKKTLRKE